MTLVKNLQSICAQGISLTVLRVTSLFHLCDDSNVARVETQSDVTVQGELPKARVAHSCSFDPVEGDIYLWGGFTGELSRLSDFYVYRCKTATWRKLPAEAGETAPPARAFHSAVFHEGSLYLFSGANGDIRYNDVWRYQVMTATEWKKRFSLACGQSTRGLRTIDQGDLFEAAD